MKKLRCRIICIITLVVVTFGSILNPALSLRSQATGGVVEVGLLISLLIDLAVSCGILYVGHEAVESFDRDTLEDELLSYCYTAEGYNALLDIVIKEAGTKEEMQTVRDRFRAEYMSGGSNQSPDPKKVDEILKATVASISVGTALLFLKHFFANRTSSSSGSVLGAAINEASSQQVTVNSPFPSFFHISSMDNPIYSLNSISTFESNFPEFSMEGNYFLQVINPYSYDFVYLCPPAFTLNDGIVRDTYISLFLAEKDLAYCSLFLPENSPFITTFYINRFQDGFSSSIGSSQRFLSFGDNSRIYVCGNILVKYNGLYYYISSDGSIYESDLRCNLYDLVTISLSTPEGKLTSVKPIVNTDISSLVDAIGKAIADAHPDEVPSLSPEAVAAILSGVAGVYDDAVTNYYNDTSYIDQSQYITNITNVYEQAIADNPVIDIPVTDAGILSGIKAIPRQIANVLKDIFVPDIALYTFYFSDIKSKFAFIDGISEFGTNLIDILFNSDPEIPKIIIDFGLAESKYNYGGRTYALDMTFYARFKPLVDNIIVSFSWLAFVYWFYKNLPEIISGTVLSRKDYAIVKETGNTLLHGDGTFSKTRVKEIRDIDKIVTDKPGKKK